MHEWSTAADGVERLDATTLNDRKTVLLEAQRAAVMIRQSCKLSYVMLPLPYSRSSRVSTQSESRREDLCVGDSHPLAEGAGCSRPGSQLIASQVWVYGVTVLREGSSIAYLLNTYNASNRGADHELEELCLRTMLVVAHNLAIIAEAEGYRGAWATGPLLYRIKDGGDGTGEASAPSTARA